MTLFSGGRGGNLVIHWAGATSTRLLQVIEILQSAGVLDAEVLCHGHQEGEFEGSQRGQVVPGNGC